ncbi:MAG: UbiA family prenyltransferase [Phycisphaerales bacterium]|nr:UbiA family prenyltransferase [Phycisphaerales bacterium]
MAPASRFDFSDKLGMLEAMSFFSACYAAGGLGIVSMVSGTWVSPWMYASAFTMAWFVYLLHRFRISRRVGAPVTARGAVLDQHSGLVRVLLWSTGLAAIGTALLANPWLLLLLAGSVTGMLFYGSGPDGRRLRDMLLIKNACVGISMSLFWLLLLMLHDLDGPHHAGVLLPIGVSMFFMVFGDAMYCDLCDVEVDERTRSRTVPLRWGQGSTRWIADGCMLLSATVLVLTPQSGGGAGSLWILVPVLLLLLQVGLHAVGTSWVRIAVDARLLLLMVLVWISSDLLKSMT